MAVSALPGSQASIRSIRWNRIALHVRETNVPAQYFFKVMGFRAVEVIREHFADTGEDAYGMLYHLDESILEPPVPANRIARQLGN